MSSREANAFLMSTSSEGQTKPSLHLKNYEKTRQASVSTSLFGVTPSSFPLHHFFFLPQKNHPRNNHTITDKHGSQSLLRSSVASFALVHCLARGLFRLWLVDFHSAL